MPNILVVERDTSVHAVKMKEYDESILYKKAKQFKPDGFLLRATWTVMFRDKEHSVSLYARNVNGRINTENTYVFPSPVDKEVYFGSCVLVGRRNGSVESLTPEDWTMFYDHLNGNPLPNFIPVIPSDQEEEEEESKKRKREEEDAASTTFFGIMPDQTKKEKVPKEKKSKLPKEKKVKVPKVKKEKKVKEPKPKKRKKMTWNERDNEIILSEFLDCTTELEAEEYVTED
jgi:hypothetical protein